MNIKINLICVRQSLRFRKFFFFLIKNHFERKSCISFLLIVTKPLTMMMFLFLTHLMCRGDEEEKFFAFVLL